MFRDVLFWGTNLFTTLAETFFIINVLQTFLGMPVIKKGWFYFVLAMVSCGYCAFINLVFLPAGVRYVLSVVLFLAYACFFRGAIPQKILAVLCSVFFDITISGGSLWLLSFMLHNRTVEQAAASGFAQILSASLLVIVAFVLKNWRWIRKRNLALTNVQWGLILLYPLVAVLMIFSLFTFSLSLPNYRFLIFVDAFGLVFSMVIHLVLVEVLNIQTDNQQQAFLLRQQVELSKEKVDALHEAYAEQRRLTHDFNNQLATVYGLLQQKNYTAATQLVEGLGAQVYTGTLVVNTGNASVDTILSQKYSQAKKAGNAVIFQLSNLSDIPISSTDMVVLIGNLLDNSIEASHNVSKPQIRIKIEDSPDEFILAVRNKVAKDVPIHRGQLPLSTKDEPGHGIGLANVTTILKKYGAEYAISCHDGWFQFTALLEK